MKALINSRLAQIALILLAACPLQAATPVNLSLKQNHFTINSPTNTQNIRNIDVEHLAYGHVMFDYYQGLQFNSLNKILVAKAKGYLSEESQYSELLLGDLYTGFGMPKYASSTFSKLVTQDILTKIRHETWFHQAEIAYLHGDDREAGRILNLPFEELPASYAHDRKVMLANIALRQGDINTALNILRTIPSNSVIGAYASYNMAVAFMNSQQHTQSIPLLHKVMNLPVGNEEVNALKDKAALSLGFYHMQEQNFNKALSTLSRIRLDSPFANPALLGLGYSHYSQKQHKQALRFFIELNKRNAADPSVRETLLLAPRSFEALQAMPQALSAYQEAAKKYRIEYDALNSFIEDLKQERWLADFKLDYRASELDKDPMGPTERYSLGKETEALYLYKLFASKEFSSHYKTYLELQRTLELLKYKHAQLPIFQEAADHHKLALSTLVPELNNSLLTSKKRYRELVIKKRQLKKITSTRKRDKGIIHLANKKQTPVVNKLNDIKQRINKIKPKFVVSQTEKHQFLQGLVIWDMYKESPKTKQVQVNQFQTIEALLKDSQDKIASLTRTQAEVPQQLNTSFSSEISSLDQRLQVTIAKLTRSISGQREMLTHLAIITLSEVQVDIKHQLAEAHLSIARLQDASIIDDIRKRKK